MKSCLNGQQDEIICQLSIHVYGVMFLKKKKQLYGFK